MREVPSVTVTAQTSSNSSTANGVTTVFPYTFKIIDDGDIEVRVDGALQTLSTHYTVSGVGDNAGGNVTFLSAPANGAIVARRRNMALVREVDYQYQGNLPAAVLNPDQDAPVLMVQQMQEQISRSARGPAGESWDELPVASDRLDYFLAFDATTGLPELSTVTQTQVASAVAAAYAAGATADAVTFLQAGTGAVSRSVQSKLREWVSITDFGTLGAGSDATIFQAAIDAVKGTGQSLYIPPNTTIALGTTGVTIDAGITIIGANRDRCFITWTSTTMVAVTVTTANSCQFQNLYFAGPASCTAGAAISLSGSGGTANSFSKVDNCRFSSGYRQVYAPDAYAWEVTGNYFSGAVHSAVYVGNTTTADDGDSTIERNVFSNIGASGASVWQVSSGGLRIINNKMNGGLYGYFLELASAAVTSILLIEGNSIENQTHSGIVINNSAGGGAGFSQMCIIGNQFAYQPTPINALDPDAFNAGVIIVGNVIVAASGATTTTGITVTATPKSIISSNILYGSGSSGTGILTGTLSTDCAVRGNVITGFTTPVNDGGLSYSVASAASITLSTAKDVFTITGTTSITSISAASAVAGRVVTLIFQGALTFTDGSNLKLAGNFVTTADDTITLVCDGTNWYEVARSAN